MRSFIYLVFVLAACSKSTANPPAAKSTESAPNAPAAKPTPPSPISTTGACRDGWSASKTEWMGMGRSTVTVECKDGTPTATISDLEPRDEDGATTMSHAISLQAWETLWRRLEAAGWRELAASCPELATPSPIAMGITDLELSITDGTATKKLECLAMNLTDQHGTIIEAFEMAVAAAHGKSDA